MPCKILEKYNPFDKLIININGTSPIRSSLCSGFDDFLCVVSLDPINPYKYLFLIHMLLPMTMLSLNDQNHINGLMEPLSLQDGISIVVFFSKLYFHYSFYEPCIYFHYSFYEPCIC